MAALPRTGQFHAWPDSPLGLGLDQRFYRALYLPSDGLYAVGAKRQMTLIAKTKQPENIHIAWPQTNLRRAEGSEHTLTKSGIFADRLVLVLVLVYDEPRGNCPQAAL